MSLGLLIALLTTFLWASDWLLIPLFAVFALNLASARWGYGQTSLQIDETHLILQGPTWIDVPLETIERAEIPRLRWLMRPVTLHRRSGLQTQIPRAAFDSYRSVADALRQRGVDVA